MGTIVTGRAHCTLPGCTAAWPRDSVPEVACLDCGAGVGVRCRRPSSHAHLFTDFHAARDLLADACAA